MCVCAQYHATNALDHPESNHRDLRGAVLNHHTARQDEGETIEVLSLSIRTDQDAPTAAAAQSARADGLGRIVDEAVGSTVRISNTFAR